MPVTQDSFHITSQTLETLNHHVTVRDFSDEPLDDETLMTLLRAARRAPTSSNMQTYSLVVVRDPEKKKQFAEIANNQQHIITCPVFVAICADTSRLEEVSRMHDKPFVPGLELTLVSVVDAALVGMSLCLAAESLGLGTVMIGAMRNDPAAVSRLLGLPKGAFVLFGLCIGWPAHRPSQKPRLPEDLVIHFEQYGCDHINDHIHAHDTELATHYRSRGSHTPDAAWSEPIANRLSHKTRPFMRDVLEELGFHFD